MAERFRALVGINYVPVGAKGKKEEVRREPGEVFEDLPPAAVDGLLEARVIERAAGERVSAPRPAQEKE